MKTDALQRLPKRRVSVLGASGSIGQSTFRLLNQYADCFEVVALTGNGNVGELIRQARILKPRRAVIGNEALFDELCDGLAGTGIETAAGMDAIEKAASLPADWIMAAIVGVAGLKPALAAIRQGTTVALANKEALVCAGDFVLDEVRRHGTTLLPVDSEHNAIFQVFDRERPGSIEKITLTASGGPFREWSAERMQEATPQQAISHPNWSMGEKISVDSATMFNKGLEMIEAWRLFPLEPSQIDVVIHPESIIHGMVHYRDGAVLAQMGMPDMCTPIAHALAWPERMEAPVERLDFTKLGQMSFQAADSERFPSLRIARAAMEAGGAAPAILNAANETAVALFLEGKIRFTDIARVVEDTLEKTVSAAFIGSLDDILQIDHQARQKAGALAKRYQVGA